jgi:hypothetical protein
MGLVEVARGLGLVVDRGVVEPGPFAVRSLGRIGDQDVGVKLGIAVSRGAVQVGGGEVAVAPDELVAAGSSAGPAGLSLEPGRGLGSDAGQAARPLRGRCRSASPSADRARHLPRGQAQRRRLPSTAPRPRPRRSSSLRRLRRPSPGSSAPGLFRACRSRASTPPVQARGEVHWIRDEKASALTSF